MDGNITIKDLRQELVGIKNEHHFAEYEYDHGRESHGQLLYMIGQQNNLFEKIIDYIESKEIK